ncbi:hypothetical protein E2C01_071028 [Portunus trituberculatus]|uniref:Uncharacterized protein n=1 Tax=Portunus trituberculatus TaxID=210409 RepID=A0A5B7HUB5_PORTR|nr:hypothetical protein [Portunus trituberculatus]
MSSASEAAAVRHMAERQEGSGRGRQRFQGVKKKILCDVMI